MSILPLNQVVGPSMARPTAYKNPSKAFRGSLGGTPMINVNYVTLNFKLIINSE